ncbi:MAG: hypothetical protein LBG48_06030 [Rickettsiales bacterium]|nr:hypothetical protein [Rickettsiales bacterium]
MRSKTNMNLTTFCNSYNLSYEIVRPLIDKAILEHRDDCVLVIGKQRIKILDDKKFIEFINDIRRRELERCQQQTRKQYQGKIQRDYIGEVVAFSGLNTQKVDYTCINQLKQLMNTKL